MATDIRGLIAVGQSTWAWRTVRVGVCLTLCLAAPSMTLADEGRLVEVRILFQEARLVVEEGESAQVLVDPQGPGVTSPVEPIVLVPSSHLRVVRLAPGLYQVVAKAQETPFWRVHAPSADVQVVRHGIVGSDGGLESDPSWLEVTHAAPEAARAGRFEMRIQDLELVFRPEDQTVLLEGGELQLGTEEAWDLRHTGPFFYHLRRKEGWDDAYLAIDAGGKAVGLVRPGTTFGARGETWQLLDAPVQSVWIGGRYENRSPAPKLLEPEEGAVLDNACRKNVDPAERQILTFRWSPIDGAEHYELFLAPPSRPTFGKVYKTRQPFLRLVKWGGNIGERNRMGWRWKVRAVRERRRLPWSETRTYDVEPIDTDADPQPWMLDDPPRPTPVGKGGRRLKPAKAPKLLKPEAGDMLDNGRADGLDILSWEFSWRPVRGCNEYELILVRFQDGVPLLRERVQGTRFSFTTDEYRIFGLKRRPWRWRVRALDRNGPGCWSERRWFDVEPLDFDPPDPSSDIARSASSADVPKLLRPKPGAALENGIPAHKGTSRRTWAFKWRAVKGAEAYDIEYGLRGRTRPRRERVEKTSFRVVQTGYYFHDLDWFWRVRAIRDGAPLPWSLKRPFDVVEPD